MHAVQHQPHREPAGTERVRVERQLQLGALFAAMVQNLWEECNPDGGLTVLLRQLIPRSVTLLTGSASDEGSMSMPA